MINNRTLNKFSIILTGVIIVLLFVISYSYSFYLINPKQSSLNSAYSGCLDIEGSINGNFSLTDAYPMSFADAKRLSDVTPLTVTNNCEIQGDAVLRVYLEVPSTNTLAASNIDVALTDSNFVALKNINPSNDPALYASGSRYLLYSDVLNMGDTKTFGFRMWLDEEVSELLDRNLIFNSKLRMEVRPRT